MWRVVLRFRRTSRSIIGKGLRMGEEMRDRWGESTSGSCGGDGGRGLRWFGCEGDEDRTWWFCCVSSGASWRESGTSREPGTSLELVWLMGGSCVIVHCSNESNELSVGVHEASKEQRGRDFKMSSRSNISGAFV